MRLVTASLYLNNRRNAVYYYIWVISHSSRIFEISFDMQWRSNKTVEMVTAENLVYFVVEKGRLFFTTNQVQLVEVAFVLHK